MDLSPEGIVMNNTRFSRLFGFILLFGLCIAMLSRVTDAQAAENEVKLNVSTVSIIKDGTYRLKVYNLSEGQTALYRSADSSVAMVSKSGKVTGISCGSTVITVTVVEGDTAVATLQCDVLIGPAAVSIKLTKTELVLAEGKMKALKTIIFPLNTVETATFYSEDVTIAKVSSAGRVRAEAAGTVQIYAFLSNGQSAVCNVTVLSKDDYDKYLQGITLDEIAAEQLDDSLEETEDAEPVVTEEPAEPTAEAEPNGATEKVTPAPTEAPAITEAPAPTKAASETEND